MGLFIILIGLDITGSFANIPSVIHNTNIHGGNNCKVFHLQIIYKTSFTEIYKKLFWFIKVFKAKLSFTEIYKKVIYRDLQENFWHLQLLPPWFWQTLYWTEQEKLPLSLPIRCFLRWFFEISFWDPYNIRKIGSEPSS